MIGSVIIPAWNEAAVIERTLNHLYAGLPDGVDVVVACNGCTDDTAAIARRVSPTATVLELPAIGKSGAIRAAEQHTSVLPRIYLDADTDLTGGAAGDLLRARGEGAAIAARPPIEYATDRASRSVRRYYAVRRRLPAIAADLCGAGVYAFGPEARSRFDEFPALVADDLFAARIVDADEVTIVDTDPVRVHVPRTARAQVDVLARVFRGNRQFAASRPDLARPSTASTARDLVKVARQAPIDAATYAAFVVCGRVASRLTSGRWSRDGTARDTAPDTAAHEVEATP